MYEDIKVIKDNPNFPFIVVDNWYTAQEEKTVWSELDYYSYQENIDRAENTVVARNNDGSARSTAYRWYVGEYYSPDKFDKVSHVQRYTEKLRQEKLHKSVAECMPYGRSWFSTNRDSTLISYYEENDHYQSHHDTFMWTVLIWFCRQPKIWTGGDLDFPEPEIQVNFKHNRAVLFPCCYLHRVSPVKFTEKPKQFGMGRYTITHFLYTVPQGNTKGD